MSKIRHILILFSFFGIFGAVSLKGFGQIDYKDGFKNLEKEISEHLTNKFLGNIKQNIQFFIMISIGKNGKIRDINTVGVNDTTNLRDLTNIIRKTNGKWENHFKKKSVVGIPVILEYDNSDNSKCKIENSEINAIVYKDKKEERVFNLPLIKLIFYPTIK